MAGFEVVVRPVVFPDIRPAPARSLPPPSNPDQGFATIRGNGAKSLTLSNSYSVSSSTSRPTETERRYDEVRVYQENDDGSINKKNFVDVEAPTRIKMRGGKGTGPTERFSVTGEESATPSKGTSELIYHYYARQLEEKSNIEIKKRDQVRKNQEAQGE